MKIKVYDLESSFNDIEDSNAVKLAAEGLSLQFEQMEDGSVKVWVSSNRGRPSNAVITFFGGTCFNINTIGNIEYNTKNKQNPDDSK